MLVLAVGENSEWGRTMALVVGEASDTPLQASAWALPLAGGGGGAWLLLLLPPSAAHRPPALSAIAGSQSAVTGHTCCLLWVCLQGPGTSDPAPQFQHLRSNTCLLTLPTHPPLPARLPACLLQEKLGWLAAAIGKLGLFVAVVCFIVLLVR